MAKIRAVHRVLVVGGCHVDGFQVDPEESFVVQLEASLRKDFAIAVHKRSYVNLGSAEAVRQACREVRPELLIVQLGNYECPYRLNRQWGKLRNRWRAETEAASDQSYQDGKIAQNHRPFSIIHVLKPLLMDLSHFLLSPFFEGMGEPTYNGPDLMKSTDQFLCELEGAQFGSIMMLSPLPVRALWKNHVRRQGARVMRRVAEMHGVAYLDAHALMSGAPGELWCNDWMHLSALGHRRLAEILSVSVKHILLRRSPVGLHVGEVDAFYRGAAGM